MPLSIGKILNNRYRIDKQIGQGGYGSVYRAFDLTLAQPCAIKENLSAQPELQRQFEREALILARMRHPNLPRVIDHFILPEQGQYLVMDFIEGYSLYHLLRVQQNPLPESKALAWIDQVCQALAYLHRQDPPIIHRDIKPHNIIITPEGQAILVDFGLSKFFDEQLKTTTGARGLTYGYAPPEQYGQGRTDTRSDVYALGATLYTMLTQQRPPDAIDRLVNHTPLLPPGELNPHLSPHIEQAVLKAMELSTTDRFESVETFRQSLILPITRPAVRIQSLVNPPQTRPSFWLRRTLAISLASMTLIGTAGLGYWAWQSATFATTATPTPTHISTRIARQPTVAPLVILTPNSPPLTVTQAVVAPTFAPSPTATIPPPPPTPTLIPPTHTPIPPTNTPAPPTHTPTPAYPFEVVDIQKRTDQSITIFEGTITDTEGKPLDGVFVQAVCGTYSTISFPSGATPWGTDKGPDAWAPGHYDINLAQPQPCTWQLTVVDTADRRTVKANLSAPTIIEVAPGESPIVVNWHKLY